MKKLLSILFLFFIGTAVFAGSFGVEERMPGEPFLTEFSVFPNPTTGNITLSFQGVNSDEPFQIKVYNLIGQEMRSEVILPFDGAQTMKLDLSKYPKGIYMIEISSGDKKRSKRVSLI